MEEKEKFFITRHTEWPRTEEKRSEKFEGITEKGEILARERAKEIADLIENMDKGSIMFFGGASGLKRTQSTMEVYTDELKELFKNRDDVIFVNSQKIKELSKEKGATKTAKEIVEQASKNPDSKIIIEFPLWIKQFGDSRWKEYLKTTPREMSDNQIIKNWIKDKGQIQEEQIGPNPEEVAKNYLEGMKRLRKFIGGFFPERPVVISIVGHSGELDALFVYLANEGNISEEGFRKIEDKIINETEPAQIEFLSEGKIKLKYRDKEFIYNEAKSEDSKY